MFYFIVLLQRYCATVYFKLNETLKFNKISLNIYTDTVSVHFSGSWESCIDDVIKKVESLRLN